MMGLVEHLRLGFSLLVRSLFPHSLRLLVLGTDWVRISVTFSSYARSIGFMLHDTLNQGHCFLSMPVAYTKVVGSLMMLLKSFQTNDL